MRSIKRTAKIAAIAAILIWFTSPLTGEEKASFLKGKVYLYDEPRISLSNKCITAEKDFIKHKTGDVYLTGYAYQSRHSMHIGPDWKFSEPFRVLIRANEIELDRSSKRKKKGTIRYTSEDETGPVGIIFLHRIVNDEEEIVDTQLIDLDRTYEFTEAPIYWFGNVDTEESLQYVESQFDKGRPDLQKTSIFIISTHDTPKSYDFLLRVAQGKYENELRKGAIFWLGNYQDSKSLEALKDIYEKEKEREVKKQIVFSLSLSDQEEAVVEMINIAKKDTDQEVRKNALFWLGQKASEKSAGALKDVVESDEDIEVKDSAVFAISQLPKERSIPMLIDIAKTNKSPSVSKKAIFWLGQVGGDEALKFFEDILLKKN